jgi:hypothetical protein
LRLVGYWLGISGLGMEKYTSEIRCRLEDHASIYRYGLEAIESDACRANSPVRLGLWRALRRLICNRCEPRTMPLSFLDVADFLNHALSPCSCGMKSGLDGIIVISLSHLCADKQKLADLVVCLAEAGKHLIAEDGVCLSCCHPSARLAVQKKKWMRAS